MLDTLSQFDQAIRGTLVHRAEGKRLQRMSAYHGLAMPEWWDEASWRAALKAVAYGRRGVYGTTLAFLEGAFTYLAEDVQVTLDPATPARITAVAGPGTFTQAHVNRWIRIDGLLYTSVGPWDVAATAGDYLDLAPCETKYFNAASWAVADTATATFLAFTFDEPTPGPLADYNAGYAAKVIVTLYGYGGSSGTPPTYIQPQGTWLLFDAKAAAFHVGATVWGTLTGATGVVRYIIDNGATGALQLSQVDGVFADNEPLLEADVAPPGSALANGTTGRFLTAYDNEAGGGFAVGNVVDGALSGAQGTINGLQDDGADGLLCIEPATGNGTPYQNNENLMVAAVKRGEANGDTLAYIRPAGQPYGGHIQADEFEVGDPLGAGPHPLYLIGSTTAQAIKAALSVLLVAGVLPVVTAA